jgi:ankyrin repeat protein
MKVNLLLETGQGCEQFPKTGLLIWKNTLQTPGLLHGDKKTLTKELRENKANINTRDSMGRTSMDLAAALTGQIELMDLVESNAGEFAF